MTEGIQITEDIGEGSAHMRESAARSKRGDDPLLEGNLESAVCSLTELETRHVAPNGSGK